MLKAPMTVPFPSGLIKDFTCKGIFLFCKGRMVLGWITTLIATPANQWVIKFITTGEFASVVSLSGLNTQIGPKFWLHIMFFVFVIVGLYITRRISAMKNKDK